MGQLGQSEKTSHKKRWANTKISRVLRQRALDAYYADPRYCKHCGNVIEVPADKKPSDIRSKKFCDNSCAAKHNNKGVDRWATKREITANNEIVSTCEDCGNEIINKPIRRKDRGYGFTHYIRKYCDDCVRQARIRNLKHVRRKKAIENGIHHTITAKKETLEELIVNGLTKGGLKELTKDFGYYGWKGSITKHARRIFAESNQDLKCRVCGFDFHVHVCHIKEIKEFSDNDKISEINALNNLIALCPNHHIMFDRKEIDLESSN
jgi:hypothetical protein